MSKKRRSAIDTDKENEVLDRMDCINRAIANLKTDIPDLVRNALLDILKERKKYVEVGYR
jgi:hypothetical protein